MKFGGEQVNPDNYHRYTTLNNQNQGSIDYSQRKYAFTSTDSPSLLAGVNENVALPPVPNMSGSNTGFAPMFGFKP